MFDSKQIERDAIAAFKSSTRLTIAAQSIRKSATRSSAGLYELSATQNMKRGRFETNEEYQARVLDARTRARRLQEQREQVSYSD